MNQTELIRHNKNMQSILNKNTQLLKLTKAHQEVRNEEMEKIGISGRLDENGFDKQAKKHFKEVGQAMKGEWGAGIIRYNNENLKQVS
jgi:hypothetical protein